MLKKFGMESCTPSTTHLPAGINLSVDDCPANDKKEKGMKKVLYQEALGSLMWLQVATRPDLFYLVNILFCFTHNPGKQHWIALKHMLSYIKDTTNYGIIYRAGESLNPIGYMNVDFVGCKETRKLTEKNIFIVAGGPVSWKSKR